MTTKSEFLSSLDNCSTQDEWENIYATAKVEFTRDDAFEIFASQKPYAQWFGFRFDAGPPGKPLPSFEEAMERVLKAPHAGGKALEAFRVIFNDEPLPDNLPPELVLAIMCNSAGLAMASGTTWFTTWLATRAGLAAIALGQPEKAWRLLDSLTLNGQRHPNLNILSLFERLRGHANLEKNLLIYLTIHHLWPSLKVPIFPQFPAMPQNSISNHTELSVQETLDALVELGAEEIAKLILEMLAEHERTKQLIKKEQAAEHESLQPQLEQFLRQLKAQAHRLGDPRTVNLDDVQRAVSQIESPELSLGMLELVSKSESPPLEYLLEALVVREALAGTSFKAHWKLAVRRMAADAIYELENTALFPLRLELLDELIQEPPPFMSLSELHFQRANTRTAVAELNPDTIELILKDYRAAIELARDSKEDDRFGAAASGFCHVLFTTMPESGRVDDLLHQEVFDFLAEADTLELSPFRSAQLLLAQARLVSPEEAVDLLNKARKLLDNAEPLKLTISTELVLNLLNADQISEALEAAQVFLKDADFCHESPELGILRLAYGQALIQANQATKAEAQLKSALPLIRGNDAPAETTARLLLAGIFIGRSAWNETDEQFRQLEGRLPKLNKEQRLEYLRLKDASANAHRETSRQHINKEQDPDSTQPDMDRLPLNTTEQTQLLASCGHPAGQIFIKTSIRLASRTQTDLDPLGMLSAFTDDQKAQLRATMAAESLFGQPEKIEATLIKLEGTNVNDPALPGALAARALLLAHLARIGQRSHTEVSEATELALQAIQLLGDANVRAVLLRGIAEAWSPADHIQDPIRDFGLAATILRDVLELEGGEELASDDSLFFLARALRYSGAGDIQANLQEASRLYEKLCERRQLNGAGDLLANALCNWAEVESQIFKGPKLERLQRCETMLENALSAAESDSIKANAQANLAWQKTLVGRALLPDKTGKEKLQEALQIFDSIDKSAQTPHERSYTEGNRTVCLAEIALSKGNRRKAAEAYRERLQQLDDVNQSYERATTMHNIATILLSEERMTPEELAEGIRYCEKAIKYRTLEANPRHHWETALMAGATIALAMDPTSFVPAHGLPWPVSQFWNKALMWLRKALKAATILGAGEELVQTAHLFWRLVSSAPTTKQAIDVADEAWSALQLASPYLLLHEQTREAEAFFAHQVAAILAYRISNSPPVNQANQPALASVLEGQYAEPVLKWLRRGNFPLRRPLQARLQRPPTVPHSLWSQWSDLLRTKNLPELTNVFNQLRAHDPGFLAENSSLAETWNWLDNHEGAALINVVLATPVSLALIIFQDKDGQKRECILGLNVPPAPFSTEKFTELMRGAAHDAKAVEGHNKAAQWAREHIATPLLQFLENTPQTLIWVPGPKLRLIAPTTIWNDILVLNALSIDLPDLKSPARRRSTLLVLADPDTDAQGLGSEGQKAFEKLATIAQTRGPIRLLASVGSKYGRQLLGNSPDVRNTPASPKDILAEAGEHNIIVIVAHGNAKDYSNAALSCLNATGDIEFLDAKALANTPDPFTGATIILLSCEGGQVSQSWAEPRGLAGTLISAGARYVVAPLWPVRLDLATQVGTAVLNGLANGQQPWDVLANLTSANGSGPILGPPRPLSEQRAQATLNSQAFVTWVG